MVIEQIGSSPYPSSPGVPEDGATVEKWEVQREWPLGISLNLGPLQVLLSLDTAPVASIAALINGVWRVGETQGDLEDFSATWILTILKKFQNEYLVYWTVKGAFDRGLEESDVLLEILRQHADLLDPQQGFDMLRELLLLQGSVQQVLEILGKFPHLLTSTVDEGQPLIFRYIDEVEDGSLLDPRAQLLLGIFDQFPDAWMQKDRNNTPLLLYAYERGKGQLVKALAKKFPQATFIVGPGGKSLHELVWEKVRNPAIQGNFGEALTIALQDRQSPE